MPMLADEEQLDPLLARELGSPSVAEDSPESPADGFPNPSSSGDLTEVNPVASSEQASSDVLPPVLPSQPSEPIADSPTVPATPVMPQFLKRPYRFQINGGAGNKSSRFVNADLSSPITTDFDAVLRLSYATGKETVVRRGRTKRYYYTYSSWYGYRSHSYWSYYNYDKEEDASTYGGDLSLRWKPCSGIILDPYVGVGLGYVSMEKPSESSGYEHESDGVTLAAQIGLAINWKRICAKGEFLARRKTRELVGDVGYRMTDRLTVHLIVDHLDFYDADPFTMFGGGLSYEF